ncbi:MAG TPA: hypothetical protein VFN95_12340 [Flavitalea sp.]|nr:hypothetical protein [Flavitalea sp.]
MIKPRQVAELDKLLSNHVNNMTLPILTQAAFIKLDHLKDFISQIEARHNTCDTIKICFVRYEFKPNSQILLAGKDATGKEMTQISLVLAPVKTADPSVNWRSALLTKPDGALTLCVCEPEVDDFNDTGLCPPNQGCPPPSEETPD